MERIENDTRRVNETRTEGERQRTEHWQQGNNLQECKPLRVVSEVVTFDLKSTERGDALCSLVERVAYGSHQGYRFPSVRRKNIPKTHALAVAMLEAVRRGADVSGSAGGDQTELLRSLARGQRHKRRPFIKFPDAFALYIDLWGKQESGSVVSSVLRAFNISGIWGAEATPPLLDLEQGFLQAVQLHQARGAILLTGVDGVGEHSGDVGTSTSAANVVIHVDPTWLADLVRRVVDIRLLDPAQQGGVLQTLEESAPACSSLELSVQHERFFKAGEVSRDFLKFLWLREVNLGPTSTEAPPLKMTEDDIDVVVDGLLDIRFMFRVRGEHGDVVPDRYIVSSCLPDHAGGDVDPAKMLELKYQGAIFSRELKLVGARGMPPGLVPRLLAWCGRGHGRIQACWKRGVCFAYKSHLVLVHEGRIASGWSSMTCHAMGSAHDEKAGDALAEVVQELNRLIIDKVYGFPGVRLVSCGTMVKRPACSDGELEATLARLESSLEDHMNVKFDELTRKSDKIAGEQRVRISPSTPIGANQSPLHQSFRRRDPKTPALLHLI